MAATFQTKVCFDWPTAGSLYLGVLDWLIQHMFIILAWKNKRFPPFLWDYVTLHIGQAGDELLIPLSLISAPYF